MRTGSYASQAPKSYSELVEGGCPSLVFRLANTLPSAVQQPVLNILVIGGIWYQVCFLFFFQNTAYKGVF